MNDAELGRIFKAIGEPARLAILRKLPTTDRCEGVYNVSELAEELGLSQPAVSRHLGILKTAGLVKCRRMCRDVYYWLDKAAVKQALAHTRDALLQRDD